MWCLWGPPASRSFSWYLRDMEYEAKSGTCLFCSFLCRCRWRRGMLTPLFLSLFFVIYRDVPSSILCCGQRLSMGSMGIYWGGFFFLQNADQIALFYLPQGPVLNKHLLDSLDDSGSCFFYGPSKVPHVCDVDWVPHWHVWVHTGFSVIHVRKLDQEDHALPCISSYCWVDVVYCEHIIHCAAHKRTARVSIVFVKCHCNEFLFLLPGVFW